MAFKYKTKKEFVSLDTNKKVYYLARLYIRQDTSENHLAFRNRLFPLLAALKNLTEESLSVLYNYLSDNKHNGLPLWKILPRAILYDAKRRRKEDKKQVKCYEEFNLNMLKKILEEDEDD